MTFRVRDGEGAQALDINLLLSRLLGRGVIAGGEVVSGGGDYVVEVPAMSVYINGETYASDRQELDLKPHVDPNHPRKALIYIDTEGEYVVAPGEPEEAQPRDQYRFDCFRPAPPDLSSTDAVVLAEVWLDPDDNRLTDADIRDRRLMAALDIHSVTVDTLDVSKLIDGTGASHTGELAGDETVSTADEVRDAINTDEDHGSTASHNYFSGSHDDLSDVSPDDHHTRFDDSEARDAVRGALEATALTGDSGTVGDHIEYTGSDLVWSAPPTQQADVISSGTVTHTGGNSTTVLLAGVTTDETAQFEVAVGVDQEPSWSSDYAYSVDVSRQWDDTNGEVDVELTLSWETDPGSGNDLDLAWTAWETTPVVVEGRYSDADAIAAMDGASISPRAVDVSTGLTAPVYDDVSTITGMELGDTVIASGDGASSFGQYLYDGSEWVGPFGTSVASLSGLSINTDKNWQGYPISNVGAPSNATDVARQQEIADHEAVSDAHHSKTTSSEIDHADVSNVQSDQHHERYTDDEAVAAAVGRSITSSLTGAAIPDGEALQNFHYIPADKQMTVVRAEVMDAEGVAGEGLAIELYDRETESVAYSQTTRVESGSLSSPLKIRSGETTVSVRIVNNTGGEIAASGSMSFEIH